MSGLRLKQLGCAAVALSMSTAQADRALRLSTMHLVTESPALIVTHDHDVTQVNVPGVEARGRIFLDLNSTLRMVRKDDNAEIFNQPVMPLTALTSVNDGRYFAGLSSLQTLSSDYNFILISEDGKIVATALITVTSGHCRSVSATTTNFIRWFNEKAPEVHISFEDGQVNKITVVNPYDRGTNGAPGTCVIHVEAAR
jgi:hypothetical protein